MGVRMTAMISSKRRTKARLAELDFPAQRQHTHRSARVADERPRFKLRNTQRANMIEAICSECNTVFTAIPVLDLVQCPNCRSDKTHAAVRKQEEVNVGGEHAG